MAFGDEGNRTGGHWSTSRETRATAAAPFHRCDGIDANFDHYQIEFAYLQVGVHRYDLRGRLMVFKDMIWRLLEIITRKGLHAR